MKKIKQHIWSLVAATILCGCSDSTAPTQPPADRTVIVYMVANNNLAPYAVFNINEMESAFSSEYGGRLMLFFNDAQGNCRLYEIAHDTDPKRIASPVIKEYPYKTNPCLPETLSRVIADCRAYSGESSYSMIFWSHGSGWIPQGMAPAEVLARENPSDRQQSAPQYTFGATNSFDDELEMCDLADALPRDLVFDFISFDACHMGSIESVYELRNNARYVISSTAEILAEGYPYDEGLKYVLKADVLGIAKTFFDSYDQEIGVWRSATISAVDCSKLEALAASVKQLVAKGGVPRADQQFGRNLGSSANFSNLLWDLSDMVYSTWDADDLSTFFDAMNAAVIYKAATPLLFEGDYYGTIEVETFSGLSVYIPKLSQPMTLDIYTTYYDWATDTELYTLAQ